MAPQRTEAMWGVPKNMELPLGSAMTLLGLPFYEIGEQKLRGIIRIAVADGHGLWLNLVTQDHLQLIETDQELHRLLIQADILIPESWLLVSACHQMFQSSLTLYSAPALLSAAMESMESPRVAILLPPRCVLEAANEWWTQHFPNSPPPQTLVVPTETWVGNQTAQFMEEVMAVRPNLLCAFLPSPSQERWMSICRRYLPGAVIASVGPCAEVAPLALTASRMQNRLEHSKTQLLKRIADQSQRLAITPAFHPQVARPAQHQKVNSRWVELSVAGRFDAARATAMEPQLAKIFVDGASLLLDLSRVSFIDSSALGLLIHLLKNAGHLNRQLILINPSRTVIQALKLIQLEGMFEIAPDIDSARVKGDLMARQDCIWFERAEPPKANRIFWRGSVQASDWEKYWHGTLDVIENARKMSSTPRDVRFELDLSHVTFIDSLGVGLLIRLMKWAREQLTMLSMSNPSTAVQQVVSLAQLQRPLMLESLPHRMPPLLQ